MNITNNLDQLVIARRLLLDAQRADDRRKGKQVDEKTAKEEMEEDQALISGDTPVEGSQALKTSQPTADVQVNLSDLFARLKATNTPPAGEGTQQVQVNFQQVVESQANLKLTVLDKVEGLVRRSQTLAETDRYRLEFTDGATFKITDKWSNRSTTVYGDPHVDVDDVAGGRVGDFQDLKGSDSQTTFMLKDGTRLTFTARDNGLIEAVDIFKGDQHLGGIGAASKQWNEKDGLFAAQVNDESAASSGVPLGDTVYAGGDGNDWFTSNGKLLWGKTTGPTVTSRPYAVMQLQYQEKISQQISVQVVNKQA